LQAKCVGVLVRFVLRDLAAAIIAEGFAFAVVFEVSLFIVVVFRV